MHWQTNHPVEFRIGRGVLIFFSTFAGHRFPSDWSEWCIGPGPAQWGGAGGPISNSSVSNSISRGPAADWHWTIEFPPMPAVSRFKLRCDIHLPDFYCLFLSPFFEEDFYRCWFRRDPWNKFINTKQFTQSVHWSLQPVKYWKSLIEHSDT